MTNIKLIAENYNYKAGLAPLREYKGLKLAGPQVLAVARQYESMADNISGPEVLEAYGAFKRELLAQYEALQGCISFEFTTVDPYKTSAELFQELEDKGRIKVFTGGEYHKGLGEVNNIFRAVHDVLGHFLGRHSFSPNGEYMAYKKHCQMFSPLARRALFTETLAQNCYYMTFGRFAPQKTMIFPQAYINLF